MQLALLILALIAAVIAVAYGSIAWAVIAALCAVAYVVVRRG